MPFIYTLIIHSKHGTETVAHLSAEKRDRQHRECLLETAGEEWGNFDDSRREEYPEHIGDYLEDPDDSLDVLDLTAGRSIT